MVCGIGNAVDGEGGGDAENDVHCAVYSNGRARVNVSDIVALECFRLSFYTKIASGIQGSRGETEKGRRDTQRI